MFFRRRQAFHFHDLPAPTGERDFEIVEPAAWRAPAFLASLAHPLCRGEPGLDVRPGALQMLLDAAPRGRERCDPATGIDAAYRFWIRLLPRDGIDPPVEYAGTIALRVGHGDDLVRYLGHIGFSIIPPARGRRIAARATRLLLPLAKLHGLHEVSITCNPDNVASRRSIELAGGRYVNTVDVPPRHPLHARGERQKHRYVLSTG